VAPTSSSYREPSKTPTASPTADQSVVSSIPFSQSSAPTSSNHFTIGISLIIKPLSKDDHNGASSVTALEVISGREGGILDAVIMEISNILVEDVQFDVVSDIRNKVDRKRLELVEVKYDDEKMFVVDGKFWIGFHLPFRIVNYSHSRGLKHNKKHRRSSVSSTSAISELANQAVRARINDGTLLKYLQTSDPRIQALSVSGEEENIREQGNVFSLSSVYEPLNPGAMDPIRITGIILLCFSLFSVCSLLRVSHKRKKNREKEGQDDSDNMLASEEGVNNFLQVAHVKCVRNEENEGSFVDGGWHETKKSPKSVAMIV